MDRADQKVALVWIYTGQKPSERLETIGSIDGQHLKLIAVGNAEIQRAAELFSFSRPDVSLQTLDSVSMQAIWQAIPPEAKAIVFWIDDEKLVSAGPRLFWNLTPPGSDTCTTGMEMRSRSPGRLPRP